MSKMGDLTYKHVNVPGLFSDVLDEVAEPALQDLVKSTENTWDDALVQTLWPAAEAMLKDKVKELWEKHVKPEEPPAPTA